MKLKIGNPSAFWLLLLSIFGLLSCNSVEKYNTHLDQELTPAQLKKDVDYTYETLKRFHPELHWYISEEALQYKFDSLKQTLDSPLTPRAFYYRIAPVVAEVRQGHLRVSPPIEKFNRKEIKQLKNQKGLFGRMDYAVENDRIFVIANRDSFAQIVPGTELLSINGVEVSDLLNHYRKLNSSDGFNTTFQRHFMAQAWPSYHAAENGILDSVRISTQYEGEVKEFYIYREHKSSAEREEEKARNKEMYENENKTKDYDPATLAFNRNLIYKDQDSLVAYMKIKTFSGFLSKKFYQNSFAEMKETGTQYLILDVRDNLGGSLSEIHNLYSYLAKDDFVFMKDMQVTGRNSMLHAQYFKARPWWAKPFLGLFAPYYYMRTLTSTRKKDGKFVVGNRKYTRPTEPQENAFAGKVYVLINGGSFSAASVLPAKMQNDGRAILVGEETGGAHDGTVAGRYTMKDLPESDLRLPVSLILIQPEVEFENEGKGVKPDIEIIPTIDDLVQKNDIELNWILQEIETDSGVQLKEQDEI